MYYRNGTLVPRPVKIKKGESLKFSFEANLIFEKLRPGTYNLQIFYDDSRAIMFDSKYKMRCVGRISAKPLRITVPVQ